MVALRAVVSAVVWAVVISNNRGCVAMATLAQPEPEPERSEAATLDEIAAEIARAEALLAADIERDIAAVQSRTTQFAATEREWATTSGVGRSEQQRDRVEEHEEVFTEEERAQLLERILGERRHPGAQPPETQPLRAWEADTTAAGAATTTAAASNQAQEEDEAGEQHGRPARPRPSQAPKVKVAPGQSSLGESRRRPRSAPLKQHLPGDGAPDRRYRPSRQELERQAREKLDRECTFKPNSSRQRTRKATASTSMSRQERIDNLAKSKLNLWRKREQQRIENAEKEAQQCTFEPKVTTTKKGGPPGERSDSAHAREARGASGSVTDRLYHEADGRLANRQRLKREKEAAELTRLQFAPTLNSTSTATTGVLPIMPPILCRTPLPPPARQLAGVLSAQICSQRQAPANRGFTNESPSCRDQNRKSWLVCGTRLRQITRI